MGRGWPDGDVVGKGRKVGTGISVRTGTLSAGAEGIGFLLRPRRISRVQSRVGEKGQAKKGGGGGWRMEVHASFLGRGLKRRGLLG